MKPVVVFVVLLLVLTARGFAGETSGWTDGGNEPLRMEELEVSGLRDKQEVLYQPVPRGIVLPSPVRYDLFLEDMGQPVLDREFLPGESRTGGSLVPRSPP